MSPDANKLFKRCVLVCMLSYLYYLTPVVGLIGLGGIIAALTVRRHARARRSRGRS